MIRFVTLGVLCVSCVAFSPPAVLVSPRARQSLAPIYLSGKDDNTQSTDAVSKASWYAVEAFGKIFGSGTPKSSQETANAGFSLEDPPRSTEETLTRIQDDFERSYFLSGEVDKLIYDEQCIFSDPLYVEYDRMLFVRFTGS